MPVVPAGVYEVGSVIHAVFEGPSFPLPAPGLLVPPSVIEDLSARLGNLEYGHGQLVKKMIQVSDAEMGTLRDRREAVGLQVEVGSERHATQRIQQLQTTVTEMSSQESTLMQCILGMDRRLAELERRPSGP
ncbi:hypothetical protein Tco_1396455 [Tanacetum coccineum]